MPTDPSRPLMLGTPTRRASPWRREDTQQQRERKEVSPRRQRVSLWEAEEEEPLPHVAPVSVAKLKPRDREKEREREREPRLRDVIEREPVRARETRDRRDSNAMSKQTVELLFAQQSAMEGNIEAKLFSTVNALRDEVDELQGRLDKQDQDYRKNASAPSLVEQAVKDALALYADNGASALGHLADELTASDPADVDPYPHQAVCRNLKAALASFISQVVAKQISVIWEDPKSAVPQSVRRHIGDVVRSFQESHHVLADEVHGLAESHPLAPRVAAMESQVSRMQVGTTAPPSTKVPDNLLEQMSQMALDLSDTERRCDDLEARIDNTQDELGVKVDSAKRAADDAVSNIDLFKDELWDHINDTEQMLTRVVSDMRQDIQGFKDDQQKNAIIHHSPSDSASMFGRGPTNDEMLTKLEKNDNTLKNLRDEIRMIRNDLTSQIRDGDAQSTRGVNEAVARSRQDVMEVLAALRQDTVTKKELATEKKRLIDMIEAVEEMVEDSEGRAMEAALSTVETAKAATASRLSQIEDDIHQLQAGSADVMYLKAGLASLTNDTGTRLNSLEESLGRRDGMERQHRKMDQKVRDLEDKLTGGKYVTMEGLEARDQSNRANLLDMDKRIGDNSAAITALKQQRESDKAAKRAQAQGPGASFERGELDRVRSQVDDILTKMLPQKLEASALLSLDTDVKDLKRRVGDKAASDNARISDMQAELQRLDEEKSDQVTVNASLMQLDAEIKELKRKASDKLAADAAKANELLAEITRLDSEKANAADVAQASGQVEADLRDVKKKVADRGTAEAGRVNELAAEVQRLDSSVTGLSDRLAMLTALEPEVRDLAKKVRERHSEGGRVADAVSELQGKLDATAAALQDQTARLAPVEQEMGALKKKSAEKHNDVAGRVTELMQEVQRLNKDKGDVEAVQKAEEEVREMGKALARILKDIDELRAAPQPHDDSDLREQMNELSAELDAKADGMLLDDLTEQVHALPHEIDVRIKEVGLARQGNEEMAEQISTIMAAMEKFGDELSNGLAEARKNNTDIKGELTEITHTHSSMRDELSDCHGRICTLDGYVRELASARDGEVETLRDRLQQVSGSLDDEIKKLRRLVDRAIIALDLQGGSQPTTPVPGQDDSSGGFTRSFSRPQSFSSKKQMVSAALRDQLSRPSDRRPSSDSRTSQ